MKSVAVKIVAVAMVWMLAFGCKKQNDVVDMGAITTHELRSEQDLDILLQQIGDARIVLLGEASHGTAEYYNWRAALSKRLIQEKGFDGIAVEGEWADSYRVNNFVRGALKDSTEAVELLRQYNRWPTWMWGNFEVASLVTWLNKYNQAKPATEKAGFYGLDVYCLWEATQELMPYLEKDDTAIITAAQQVEQCFKPYSADAQEYGYAVANASANCLAQTSKLWTSIRGVTGNATATDERGFVMQQNALVALNGENYYRTSVSSYPASWNIRDRHMHQTLKRLL